MKQSINLKKAYMSLERKQKQCEELGKSGGFSPFSSCLRKDHKQNLKLKAAKIHIQSVNALAQ